MEGSGSDVVSPRSLLTEDNVTAALTVDKGLKARLIAWRVVDFTEKGDNYACVVTSVEVTYELDDKTSDVSYVVKLNPGVDDDFSDLFIGLAFDKEAKFYLDIVPELNHVLRDRGKDVTKFPKCFYANLEKGKEVIFMEDLRKQGYKMVDRKRGMDKAHITLVLKELAKLNAASLLQDEYSEEELSERYPNLKQDMGYMITNSETFRRVIKDSLKFAQQILRKVEGYERAVAWIDTLIPNIVDVFNEQLNSGGRKMLCHGDCWTNNVLFRYDEDGHPEDVMLLDLQMVSFGAPTIDLNYLLYTSTRGEVRKPNIETFLNYYHVCLASIVESGGLKVPFSQEQLLKDFKTKNTYGAIFGLMAVPVSIFECDAAVDSSISDEHIEEKLRKVRQTVLATLDTNPHFKARFLSVLDEMMENGLIQ